MTSQEIKAIGHADQSANAWLKEIALQLALLKEAFSDSLMPLLETHKIITQNLSTPEPPKQPKARR